MVAPSPIDVNDLYFSEKNFLRTAGHTFHDFEYGALADLLHDHLFQIAIYFASESLYRELKKQNFEFGSLNKKTRLSTMKYFNRYCFRATPFGLFAASGILEWSDLDKDILIHYPSHITISPTSARIWKENLKNQRNESKRYYRNPTLHLCGGEYRYFKPQLNTEALTINFQLAAVSIFPLLKRVFNFAAITKSFNELLSFCEHYTEDAKDFIYQLLSEGILLDNTTSTGQSFGHNELEAEFQSDKKPSSVLAHILSPIFNSRIFVEHESLSRSRIEPINSYVNSSLRSSGGLSKNYQQTLNHALYALNKLYIREKVSGLESFKNEFKNRFDGQTIPFLRALDPEIGIGYANLGNPREEHAGGNMEFRHGPPDKNISWSVIHQLLVNKISALPAGAALELLDEDFQRIEENLTPFAPSFSVSFTPTDSGGILINSAGGCTATALTGRFTAFNEEIAAHAEHIVKLEKEANPGIQFAEINCLTDGKYADLNRRKVFYEKQISFFLFVSDDQGSQIAPDDLLISLVNDQIILSSKKSGKRIIPRFSSAFNYSACTLPHFRFLADLQYQGIKTNLTLDLPVILPGLNFYPRVTYRKAILSPATWHIGESVLPSVLSNKNPVAALAALLRRLQVPDLFKLTEHDHSLLINSKREDDLELLFAEIKEKSKFVIKEFLTPEGIYNEAHKPLASEIVTAVINSFAVYKPLQTKSPKKHLAIERKFLPGEKWLYYKMYCINAAADEILTKILYPTIDKLFKENLIITWFFIRYTDPDHHLRIRFELNCDSAGEVINILNHRFASRLKSGNIFEMSIHPYQREIERYGARHIALVEKIFHRSSAVILHFLKKTFNDQTEISKLELALISLDELLKLFYNEPLDKAQFLQETVDGMSREFDFDKQMIRELNDRFRETRSTFVKCLETPYRQKVLMQVGFRELCIAVENLLNHITVKERGNLNALLRDIIHLHINRLFSSEQRSQEFVICYLLTKYYRGIVKAHLNV